MTDYTIANEFTLPSQGKVYEDKINPVFKLRSMTTADEMKRLNHSDRPYKAMSDLIDGCTVEGTGMSAYDMCIPDYQYMLHKLRIVTFGSKYRLSSTCPYCGTQNNSIVNLDELQVVPFDEEMFNKYSEFELPVTKKRIKIKMQTPRIIDEINVKTKEQKKKSTASSQDLTYLFTMQSLIDTIDGVKPEEFKVIPFIEKLPMMDTNYILKAAQKLNSSFGIDGELVYTCEVCGLDYTGSFRTTSEFFGPSID